MKVDEKFLLHDIIYSIPNEFFIFSILSSVTIDERVLERIEALHTKGYTLSIDSIAISLENLKKYLFTFPFLDFIKIDIQNSDTGYLKEGIALLKEHEITVVADDIKDLTAFEHAKRLGCDWYQGYFFAKPVILENAVYDPSQFAILKLYNLLMEDVNIDEITQAFEDNPEVTIQLLQFINSASFHFEKKISSIHHILTLVGRIPLGQWLMLMIYSKSVSKGEVTPLMLMVKNRTELMQNILKELEPDVMSNRLGEAYFVGVISLMDVLFCVHLESILQEINISEAVQNAVLRDEGLLGEIFALIRKIESFSTEAFVNFEQKHRLKPGTIERIVMESIKTVNLFDNPNDR